MQILSTLWRRRRMGALILTLAAAFTAAAAMRRAALRRAALREWTGTSSVIVRLTGTAAHAWIMEREGDVHLLTAAGSREPVLFGVDVPGRPANWHAIVAQDLHKTVDQLRRAHGNQYTRVWIFDAHGHPVVSSSDSRPSDAVRAAALASLSTDSVVIGHIFTRRDRSTGLAFAQRVVFAGSKRPAELRADSLLGSIVLVVDPSTALFRALDGGSTPSGGEATTLVMDHGDSVYEYTLRPGAPLRPYVRARSVGEALEYDSTRSALGASGTSRRGTLDLARAVPGTRWAVVRRAEPAVVFAAADARLVSECALVIFLVGAATWLLLFRGRVAQARRTRELTASELRYRLLADNATDVIARHDAEGRIRYVSPAVTWLLARTPAEMLGGSLAALGHPDDAKVLDGLFANVRRYAGTGRAEHRLRDASGNDIWVETLGRAVTDPHSGAITEFVTVTRDVSARREAESALRAALEFVRALVDSSPVAIMTIDLDGHVRQWNGAAERLFGWSAEEVMGRSYPLANRELREESEHLRGQTLIHEHLTDLPLRRRRKDGTLIDVSVSTGVVHGPAGEATGIVIVASDLTERARLEAQLRQAQKMDAVGRLAGGIAHDFNNLLTVITSYASMLLADLPERSAAHQDLAEIRAAAHRAAALTGQLLAFSRQQVLEPQIIDVNALIGDMEQMLRRLLPANVTLRTECRTGVGAIRADKGQIEQVLMNLVLNARDAIAELALRGELGDVGGVITIATACGCNAGRPADRRSSTRECSTAHAPDDDRTVAIVVSDTGCGMSQETLRQIFEPFFTTKEYGKGTGLGLSTVHGIINQSGGQLAVQSQPGVGTTFEIRFPTVTADAPDAPDAALPESPPDGMLTGVVLLVEDEARVRDATARVLERAGYEVLSAFDGTDGLRCYQDNAERIDVVVTDVMMPDFPGTELVARIRASGSDVPVVYMSGHTEPGPVRDIILTDHARYIQKPFAPDDLVRKVRDAIAHRLISSGVWPVPDRVPAAAR